LSASVCTCLRVFHHAQPRRLHENTVSHYHPTCLVAYLRSQARHGYWRVKLYRDHPRMTAGDDYSGWWDYAAPPLGLGWLFFLMLSLILCIAMGTCGWTEAILPARMAWGLTVALFASAALCGIDLMIRIHHLGYVAEAAAFPFMNALRAAARGVGMLAGVFRFSRGRGEKRA